MSKNTFKKKEARMLDAIPMRMLEEYIEITENEDKDPKFSTYRKIREDITEYKESDANKSEAKKKFKDFRKLWYYLEGAGHLEKAKEDRNNKHNETFKITKEGLQFALTGGYVKRFNKETWQSTLTYSAIIFGFLGLIISVLTAWFSYLRYNDSKPKIENNKKSSVSNDLIEETNASKIQVDSLKQIQEQSKDSSIEINSNKVDNNLSP